MTVERARFTIRLEPVTPLTVWSGRDLMVGVDAVVREGKLYVIDLDELLKTLELREVEGYIPRITKAGPEAALKLLESLVRQALGRVGLDRVAKLAVDCVDTPSLSERVAEINPSIVPASGLKGYIRTAILLEMLKGVENLKDVLSSGVNVYTEPKDMGVGLEARLLRRPRLRKQGGFVDLLQFITLSEPEASNVVFKVRRFYVLELPGLNRVTERLVISLDSGVLRLSLIHI
mgnify:CR=1 FL=1